MIKAGQVERTNDREYEVEERRYHTMEAAATKLQKEAKGYLDSLRGMPNNPATCPRQLHDDVLAPKLEF